MMPCNLSASALALTLSLTLPSALADAVAHCDDPAVIADWDAKTEEFGQSDAWQRLHALWLGLCQKMREGSIDGAHAAELFERERHEIIRRMHRERTKTVEPTG